MIELPAGVDVEPRYAERSSGLIVPKEYAERQPTGIDLFAGCGGFSCGFIQAGFRVVAAADNDAIGTITYMHNLGSYPFEFHFVEPEDEERMEKALRKEMGLEGRRKKKADELVDNVSVAGTGWISTVDAPGVDHFFFGDVRKLTGKAILDAIGMERGEVDCVFGGPPCQGFSRSGKRRIEDPRNSLVFEFARLVLEIYPKTMVMENVPGIMSMTTPEGVPIIDALTLVLERGDFGSADALRKSLTAAAGSGMAKRGTDFGDERTSNRRRPPKKKTAAAIEPEPQMELFG